MYYTAKQNQTNSERIRVSHQRFLIHRQCSFLQQIIDFFPQLDQFTTLLMLRCSQLILLLVDSLQIQLESYYSKSIYRQRFLVRFDIKHDFVILCLEQLQLRFEGIHRFIFSLCIVCHC